MQTNNITVLPSSSPHNPPKNQPHPSKLKPLFAIQTKWRRLIPSDIAYITKCKPKMLKTLEITDYLDAQVRTQGVRNLRRAFIDAKIISSLIIGKEYWINLPQPTNYLGHLLSSRSHYKKLFFRFQEKTHDRVLKENAAKILTGLRRCKGLSSLEIHFSCHEKTKNRILHNLTSQLRGLPKLKILHLDTRDCRNIAFQGASLDYDPNASLLKFKYPRCLSSLTLNLERAISINQKTLSTFISNLQRCNQLKSLNLNSNIIQTSYDPAPLFKALANRLKTLTITKHIAERNFHPFLDSFSHLKNLTALDLYILSDLSKELLQLFITTLYNHLASFPNFRSLSLRISNKTDSHPEFHFLFPQIQYLTQLEHLEIFFPSDADLNKSHLQSLSQALQQLHCLKELALNFPTSQVSREGIIPLALGFKNLHSLRDLSLQFPFADLSNKSIQTIFDSMAHLSLKNLNLHLGQSNTNMLTNLWKEKAKLTPLFSALYGFSLLTRVDLDLSAFKLSTAEAKHFSLALKELKHLCIFSITLPKFDFENKYEGLRSFLSSFKAMPKLSSLVMCFIEGKMGDEGVRSLVENLQACWSLRTLSLWFCEADQLTEESLHYLSMGLKDLGLLKELRLNIEREKRWRKESIFELLESPTRLKYLETLVLWKSTIKLPEIVGFAKNLVDQQKFKRLTWFVIDHRRI